MAALLAFSRIVDQITRFIGQKVRWLILAIVLIAVSSAIILKLFSVGSNMAFEIQWQLYGAVFMLASAYVLQENGHVRIDVLSNRLTKTTRNWIDFFGHLFVLLPFAGLVFWLSWPFFWDSFYSQETSINDGGLPIWPAKLIILMGAGLLVLQAISEAIKRLAVLQGHIKAPEPVALHGHNPHDFDA